MKLAGGGEVKKDPYEIRAWIWKPGEEIFADDKGVARRIFLIVCGDLDVPESAYRVALDRFGELPWVINEPTTMASALPVAAAGKYDYDDPFKVPDWNYRYESEDDYRQRCHDHLDYYLNREISNFRKTLAQEGFVEVKKHQQPRTLEKDLRLLAEYWLLGRSVLELSKQMNGYKEPESSVRKALKRAWHGLGLKDLPEQIKSPQVKNHSRRQLRAKVE
jgi:hypothetical protein